MLPTTYIRATNVAAPTPDELFDLFLLLQTLPFPGPGMISQAQYESLPVNLKKLFVERKFP